MGLLHYVFHKREVKPSPPSITKEKEVQDSS